MIRFIIQAWKTCQTCNGSTKDPNNPQKPCPACNGNGGIDTGTI